MNITEARQAVADALSTLDGVSVRLRELKNPRSGDGWTLSGPVVPNGYGDGKASVGAVILLSSDSVKADEQFDDLAWPILVALKAVDGAFGVRVEPATVAVGDNSTAGPAIVVSLEVEVLS